jgi:uncharacterized protein YvpB
MEKYNVPFISQYSDINFPEWKNQACGIVCLKMLMDYWHSQSTENKTANLESLINNRNGAFIENVGWSHSGLVSLTRSYGYDGFNKDLAQFKNPIYCFEQLKADLKRFPLIASVWNKFDPTNKGGHLIVITGIDEKQIYFNDPEKINQSEGKESLSVDEFLKAFKLRYLAIYPKTMIDRTEKIKIANVILNRSYISMIENSVGSNIFRNLYMATPMGEKDILNNGDLSCSVFVSSILYLWGLISDMHATVDSTVNDLRNFGWTEIAEPKKGCVIEWEYKSMDDGSKHKHLGFYIGDGKAISNRPESGTPEIHHWTFGEKHGQPVRKIEKIYWNNKLDK